MIKKLIDVSVWNNDTEQYFQTHKKNGVEFGFVQLSYGSQTANSKRFNQIKNIKKVFGNDRVGAYHYLLTNSNALNEAKYFLSFIKQAGLSTDTPVMIDAEGDKNNTTEAINTFSDYLVQNGYKRILVYSMAYYFNSRIIKREKLKYPNVWVANYGGSQPAVTSPKIWQYSQTGALNTDYNIIYDWEFLVPSKPTTFVKTGSQFKVKTDKVLEYNDLNFRYKTGARFTTGSIINGSPVKHAGIYRIKTASGYISANANYVKKIK